MVFAGLSVVALLGIVGWLVLSAGRSRFLVVTLALISAGILGNLYDRLALHGLRHHYTEGTFIVDQPVFAVRDWILVMIGDWPWPNFNIADAMLVCGAALLVLHSFFVEDGSSKTAGRTKTPDETGALESDEITLE